MAIDESTIDPLGASDVVNITAENCLAFAGTSNFVVEGQIGGVATITCNNCASEDGTADDFSGVDNLVDQDPDAFFTDAAGGDFSLIAGCPAIGTGKTLSTFTTDIAGVTRG